MKKIFLPIAITASILFTCTSVNADDASKLLIGRKEKLAYDHAENVLKIAIQSNFEEFYNLKTENKNLKIQVESLKNQLAKCQLGN